VLKFEKWHLLDLAKILNMRSTHLEEPLKMAKNHVSVIAVISE